MTPNAERRDVIVVGGGQAGLAVGYFLHRQGRAFTILEAAGQPAAAWRNRWESLRLFTPGRYDSLPGTPFPGDPDAYPGRDDVVAYLSDYAERFDLPVELNSRVRTLRPDGHGYVVEVDDGRAYEAPQVVIATGPFQLPRVPEMARLLHAAVVHFHSSEYRTPAALPPGPVLVVGGGNTGFQIAAELAATHEVNLAIGSRQISLPQRVLGRDLFTVLERTGAMAKTADSRLGRRLKDRETLIGSRPSALRKRGVTLRPRATDATGTTVTFEDGSAMSVSSVIWATGYRLDHSFVHAPVFDARGSVVHQRGVTAAAGLYFLGLPWLHTRGSALLGWVKYDAEYIAGRIAAVAPAAPATARRRGARAAERVR